MHKAASFILAWVMRTVLPDAEQYRRCARQHPGADWGRGELSTQAPWLPCKALASTSHPAGRRCWRRSGGGARRQQGCSGPRLHPVGPSGQPATDCPGPAVGRCCTGRLLPHALSANCRWQALPGHRGLACSAVLSKPALASALGVAMHADAIRTGRWFCALRGCHASCKALGCRYWPSLPGIVQSSCTQLPPAARRYNCPPCPFLCSTQR